MNDSIAIMRDGKWYVQLTAWCLKDDHPAIGPFADEESAKWSASVLMFALDDAWDRGGADYTLGMD